MAALEPLGPTTGKHHGTDGDGHSGSDRGSTMACSAMDALPMGEAKCQTRHSQDKAVERFVQTEDTPSREPRRTAGSGKGEKRGEERRGVGGVFVQA